MNITYKINNEKRKNYYNLNMNILKKYMIKFLLNYENENKLKIEIDKKRLYIKIFENENNYFIIKKENNIMFKNKEIKKIIYEIENLNNEINLNI